MLILRDIHKSYVTGDTTTPALKGVEIAFRKSEFVAILGPSGCGKTTLLNVIGGLDKYDSGDLLVNNTSTKDFSDSDWDSYRNHSIGFVFQSYNLIPHQTVLANVELALTLSGVSKQERKKRAMQALEKVGIADQAKKKPNQLSGGQMQRVAIARALVNDPDILLADEPTGALDTATSVQIMEILKEVAKDRLVIMVTHNPELAEEYSSRKITLLDGVVTSDSNEFVPESIEKKKLTKKERKNKKTSMSFFTALSLSLNNLMTKKARTLLTSFAGSIGIIGIALILSLSNGFQLYINKVQEDTLSTYPITIEKETVDVQELMTEMMDKAPVREEHGLDKVYTNRILTKLLKTMLSQMQQNDLNAFMQYIEDHKQELEEYTTAIKYTYNIDLNIYAKDTSNGNVQVNPSTLFQDLYGVEMGGGGAFGSYSTNMMQNMNVWSEMIDNPKLLESQYDTLYGRWPQSFDEVVLFVNSNNEISDLVLYALGLKDQSELNQIISDIMMGKEVNTEMISYSYEELCRLRFSLVLSADYFQYDPVSDTFVDRSNNKQYVTNLINNGTELKVVGIMRPNEAAAATSFSGTIGYTHALTEYYINQTAKSDIVKRQSSVEKDEKASAKYGSELRYCDVDVFSGIPFGYEGQSAEITIEDVYAYISSLPQEQQQQILANLNGMSEEEIIELFESQLDDSSETTKATLETNLKLMGAAKLENPATINFFAVDFESKDKIAAFIDNYNKEMEAAGNEGKSISYTDYIGIMMSSISTIIDTISYVLIAFVAISLVVSSIMIGIITYISVLERTKEIGILRSIGAAKKDISRVFNAETIIVGFASGTLGIGVTVLLNIPINILIEHLSDIKNVSGLPWQGGLILVAISIFLTMVAGFIPSRIAAKKDPVVALRTE